MLTSDHHRLFILNFDISLRLSYAIEYDFTIGLLKLYHSHHIRPLFQLLQCLRIVKGSKVEDCVVLSLQEFYDGLIFTPLDPNQLHCVNLKTALQIPGTFTRNFLYFLWAFFGTILTLVLPRLVEIFYTSRLASNPTPYHIIKTFDVHQKVIFWVYLRSRNQKSYGITMLMISGEREDSLSSIILQLGALPSPCISSIT